MWTEPPAEPVAPWWGSVLSTALLSVTALNYLLSLVSLVLFYVYYTHSDGCTENKVFISINMLLCLGVSVVSVLPHIQVERPSCWKTMKVWPKPSAGHVTVSCLLSVKGVTAAVRSAAVLPGHPVHHVPDLVGHDQRARWVSSHAPRSHHRTTVLSGSWRRFRNTNHNLQPAAEQLNSHKAFQKRSREIYLSILFVVVDELFSNLHSVSGFKTKCLERFSIVFECFVMLVFQENTQTLHISLCYWRNVPVSWTFNPLTLEMWRLNNSRSEVL